MEEIKMEMSTLDSVLPRHYKDFDMDVLISKVDKGEPLTEEEGAAFDEAYKIYYEKQFEKNDAEWKAWKEAHPEALHIKSVDPQRIDKR